MTGKSASTGGPVSLRASARVFSPPSRTVPPSGTFTVVLSEMIENDGCWKYMVAIAELGTPPGPTCGTGMLTGIVGTVVETRLVMVGARCRRTNRRSAETIGMTCRLIPTGNGLFCGTKNTWAPACTRLVPVAKKI